MSLLVEQSPADAIGPAEKLVKELPATNPLKVDAFQVVLLGKQQKSPKGGRQPTPSPHSAATRRTR